MLIQGLLGKKSRLFYHDFNKYKRRKYLISSTYNTNKLSTLFNLYLLHRPDSNAFDFDKVTHISDAWRQHYVQSTQSYRRSN